MLQETVHIAVPTGFFKDESLNIQGTIEHIRYLYNQGVKSVLVCGSTGEQHSLTLKEKIEILNHLVWEEELINRMEVIFGVSSIRQLEAEELEKRICNTKVAGLLLGYPPYILPTQAEAMVYTKRIINLSHKPIILYNNPKRTGFDLSLESVVQLSKINSVVGIKEAGNKERVGLLKKHIKRNNFHFYAGGEVELEEKVLQGFNRLSSIAGNIFPIECKEWFSKMLTNQEITEQEQKKMKTIIEQVYQGSPLVNVKETINQRGISLGICRSPLGNV
ncbi:dihydrodipicolinate synthase family protein [Priestia endophytica]|uniref:dihydrodipicolinate synthase family protein n=1 Tax=Priestia endophytica TaxID=135735 RepID=UPI000DCA4BDB|nr:dihydrodipicolinate synthase family protein [Priestia endophytica]RAS80346.1 dihydrodipicolinate synthase family protein [Priestia endophytica]